MGRSSILLFLVVVGGLACLFVILISAIISEGKLADEIKRKEAEKLGKTAERNIKHIETE
ncbi:hypothetical protein [Ruminococcus sp.]|uniref:hypothetical protein n=1 Tax=Ruminococcus sp. TaxID=41978 RepID=UPI0025F1F489|nr:hypothetical protein [Ruminococcus sp.]MBQ8965879.1 hypothetical protein [Ruminococcus sp.]